jgi:alanine racemase
VSQLELDLDSLINNLSLAREWAPPGAGLRAMVKANAYGHGVRELMSTFAEHADELGVATMDEGLEIRSCGGDTTPVFVMSRGKDWGHRDGLETMREARLVPVVSSVEELRLLVDRLGSSTSLAVELKLDTGMGRLGIQARELAELTTILPKAKYLRVCGILTHFASADEEDLEATWQQDRMFRKMLSLLPVELVRGAAIHSCNSGALLQRGLGNVGIADSTTTVRPGVMLYGAAPSLHLQGTPCGRRLRQVGRWTCRVLERRTVQPGQTVGYGRTWRVEGDKPVQVAVLPVGYADGFNRLLGDRGRALIRGASFPVIGRVSMDLISVLVNEHVQVGDEAVLLGAQQGELGAGMITAWDLAARCSTIPYETWTGIGARVARIVSTT